MLDKYTNILWDFDGVILDSAEVRELGFRETLQEYPANKVERLLVFHRENGGLSRYVKYRYFLEEVLETPATDERVNGLAAKFSTIMMKHLLNPELLIAEVVAFVREFSSTVNMHIVSGSDGNELRKICFAVGVSKYFASIHGSPTPKNELVRQLLERHHYDLRSTCLIGDSMNDFEAAKVNNIDFYGYNNNTLRPYGAGYIEEMKSVSGYRVERKA